MPSSLASFNAAASPDTQAPVAVRYLAPGHAAAALAASETALGVVGFGAARPAHLPAACPFAAVPLAPAAGGGMLEIWTAAAPVRFHRLRAVTGACGADVAFGAVTLAQAAHETLEAATEAAYLNIFDFLEDTGMTAPLRFWNYLTAITADERGMERYRWFNIGRHRAFTARLRQPAPPAASGVGGHEMRGASVIYFLAAREPAAAVENPRQLSAYQYPPIHGPRSPSFSRASLWRGTTLFISGTASITGHQTRHAGDLAGQIAETIENLRAVISAANAPASGNWAAKIYLQDMAFQESVEPAINALFGADSQRLYLRGDMCRKDLLLEIEAVLF